jgi:hypothetical protein
MIKHSYTIPSDNAAQWAADQVKRQEVTAEWFWENGVDHDMALWVYLEGAEEHGLDPWRLREFDEVKPGQRLFVQRNQLVAAGLQPGEPPKRVWERT